MNINTQKLKGMKEIFEINFKKIDLKNLRRRSQPVFKKKFVRNHERRSNKKSRKDQERTTCTVNRRVYRAKRNERLMLKLYFKVVENRNRYTKQDQRIIYVKGKIEKRKYKQTEIKY